MQLEALATITCRQISLVAIDFLMAISVLILLLYFPSAGWFVRCLYRIFYCSSSHHHYLILTPLVFVFVLRGLASVGGQSSSSHSFMFVMSVRLCTLLAFHFSSLLATLELYSKVYSSIDMDYVMTRAEEPLLPGRRMDQVKE